MSARSWPSAVNVTVTRVRPSSCADGAAAASSHTATARSRPRIRAARDEGCCMAEEGIRDREQRTPGNKNKNKNKAQGTRNKEQAARGNGARGVGSQLVSRAFSALRLRGGHRVEVLVPVDRQVDETTGAGAIAGGVRNRGGMIQEDAVAAAGAQRVGRGARPPRPARPASSSAQARASIVKMSRRVAAVRSAMASASLACRSCVARNRARSVGSGVSYAPAVLGEGEEALGFGALSREPHAARRSARRGRAWARSA